MFPRFPIVVSLKKEKRCYNHHPPLHLLRLLHGLSLLGLRAVQPYDGESQETEDGKKDTSQRRPSSIDSVASIILVVSQMSYADCLLLLDVGEERALVVDHKVKDAVLVGEGEVDAVDGLVLVGEDGLEVEAPEGGQHGELKLDLIALGEMVGLPVVPGVLGQRDVVRLDC